MLGRLLREMSAVRTAALAVLVLSAASAVSGGEVRAFTPPPDTPVIPWTRFSVQYAVRVVGSAGPSKVVFYLTRDGGKNWQEYGEDPDLKSPMIITVPGEGEYGFITALSTSLRPAMLPRPGTRPDRFVIVDRTPPQARWLTPAPNAVSVNAGGELTLAWEATDAHLGVTPVMIEYSADNGNTWLPLRDKLPAKGSINWAPPMLEGDREVLLRLIAQDLAGNRTIVRNRAQLSVDREAPQVGVNGPASAGGFEFDVDYAAVDSQSGLNQVELFYTTDGGNEWFYFGEDKDLTSPVKFRSPNARRVGLFLVAADKRGNRSTSPNKGTRPMLEVDLDMEAPQVTVLPIDNGTGAIGSDQPAQIRWSASDLNIKENSASVEYSVDGGSSWKKLAENLPANGSWSWTPGFKGDNVMLKVNVADRLGNTGSGLSNPFRIDDQRPDTNVVDAKPITSSGALLPASPELAPERPAPAKATTDPWKPQLPDNAADIPGTVDAEANPLPSSPQEKAVEAPAVVKEPVARVDSEPAAPKPVEKKPEPSSIPGLEGLGTIPAIADKPADAPKIPVADKPEAPKKPGAEGDHDMPKPIVGDMGIEVPSLPGAEPAKPTAPAAPAVNDKGGLPDVPPLPGAAAPADAMKVPAVAETKPAAPVAAVKPGEIPDVPAVPSVSPAAAVSKVEESDAPKLSLPKAQPGTTAPGDAGSLLEQAEQLYSGGSQQFDAAEKLTRQALDKEPNNPRACALLASILTEKEKFEDAIASAEQAVKLAPRETRYLQIYGYAQYAKANSINRAITGKLVPEAQIRSFTAQVAEALNLSEQAYVKLLSATEPAEVKEAYYRLGQIDYFRSTKLMSNNEMAAQSLRKAIANYEKAYNIEKPDYREVLQIGICYYRLMEYDQAERWLEKAQEISLQGLQSRPPKEAFFYLAMIQEKMERYEQALPFWNKVAELYPAGSKYQTLAETRVKALKRQLNQQ